MSKRLEALYVWDPLLRALHWGLALSFSFTWIMGEFGPTDMTLHFIGGYVTGALVLIRILWGVIGPQTARFGQFVKGPRAVWAYAKTLPNRTPSHSTGHNPVGALFVVAILTLTLLQVLSGLFADPEDFLNAGPLSSYVGTEATYVALDSHHILSKLTLLLVLIHVAAIVYYRLRKGENLVSAMITGHANVPKSDR